MEYYFTIKDSAEGIYKEKGSKFLSFAFPVQSEKDIEEKTADLKQKYYDARHHCYAWVLGAEGFLTRANDDGEPGHSAGDPILGQIKSKGLTNTLVVVVRYFGGTKLGVGGLINAYRTAAEDALAKCKIEKIFLMDSIKIEYEYEATNSIQKLISDFEITIKDEKYDVNCVLEGSIKIGNTERFLAAFQTLQDMGGKMTLSEINYFKKPNDQ